MPSQWKINAFFDKLKQPLAHAKPAAFTLPSVLRSALLILVPILRACVLYIYAHTVVSARLPYSTLCSTGYPPSMRTRHPTHTPHALACILHTISAPYITPVLPPASHSRALRATVSHPAHRQHRTRHHATCSQYLARTVMHILAQPALSLCSASAWIPPRATRLCVRHTANQSKRVIPCRCLPNNPTTRAPATPPACISVHI